MNKFKKRILFLIFVFSAIRLSAKSNEYELNNVQAGYIGTYIPVDFELRLYQTKKFYESLYASRKYEGSQPHDVLYIQKNICYSNLGFHDGYAIEAKKFENFKFVTDEGGVFCIDDKGYLYRKISSSDYGYKEYAEYVTKIILAGASEIQINGNHLTIDNKEYKVNPDGTFFDTTNAALWLFSDRYFVLEKNGVDGELYTGKDFEDRMSNTKDVLIKRFPGIFRTNPNDTPDYSNISKENLRLFRNLIYARNGYIFKSADLQKFFNSCSWYKPDPDFNETGIRKDEKDFIELMKKFEREK